MQEVVATAGTVSVSATAVTGNSTNFVSGMIGMMIGFGSTNPAQVTAWYTISAVGSTTSITLTATAGTVASNTPYVIVANIPVFYPHVLTYSSTVDWMFLIENSVAASALRKIVFYEYNKTTSAYTWKGFITATLATATVHTLRGFRALRYLHTTGTASASGTAVTGIGTKWQTELLAVGARIGFGSTDPTAISTWYVISAIGSETGITISSSAGTVSAGAYVIEELRFGITATNATTTNGGLHLVKGVNYSDFSVTGTTISFATSTDNVKAVYWLSDAGTAANVVTNIAACGLGIQTEVSKGQHYAYVIDGTGSTFAKVYRYNLRATGAVATGKMTLSVAYYTTGTIAVSGTGVTGVGTTFTSTMVGKRIGFGSTSPALISTWYTIASFSSTTSITLTSSAGTVSSGTGYIIDTADALCTGNELLTGTISANNNSRIGTLTHGSGAGVESLYFVTTTRVYRAAVSKIYWGNLDWVSDNAQEVPPTGVSSYPATAALSEIEVADMIDRLIVVTTGATGFRNYVTQYFSSLAGQPFDHIFGVDDKQTDQLSSGSNAYISSGTVAVSTTAVTGTNTFFTQAMVGFQIGFGSTNPSSISTWYTISAYTSATSITLSSSAGTISSGSAYVVNLNGNSVPHFNTASQSTSIWSQNGIVHIAKHGTVPALCQIYALPFGAHWTYAASTLQRVITPALYTPDCATYYRAIVVDDDHLGGGEISMAPEPYRVYYRCKGIEDDSGAWTLVGTNGDLSGIAGNRRIQFMFEFVTIGWFCVPARIMSITIVYDDTSTVTDSHYQPSAAKSDATSKKFAWRLATAFGGTVPTLRVRLYDAVSGYLLVDDASVGASGTWEKSTNGTTWGAYNTTDKGNETTYVRYTPASLGDSIKVRALLTQQ
jgi:hypothetical protein